jgi:hypothetical protein
MAKKKQELPTDEAMRRTERITSLLARDAWYALRARVALNTANDVLWDREVNRDLGQRSGLDLLSSPNPRVDSSDRDGLHGRQHIKGRKIHQIERLPLQSLAIAIEPDLVGTRCVIRAYPTLTETYFAMLYGAKSDYARF